MLAVGLTAAAAAKSRPLCPTLCDPMNCSLPGKSTGVGCRFLLQRMKVKSESEVTQSCPTLLTPWTVAYQPPLSLGFPRQKYWSGWTLPSLSCGPYYYTNLKWGFAKICYFLLFYRSEHWCPLKLTKFKKDLLYKWRYSIRS